jgi:hypothetical protein
MPNLIIAIGNEPFVYGQEGQSGLTVQSVLQPNSFYSGVITAGTSVTVISSPFTGWSFVKWAGLDGATLSTSASYTFTMPATDFVFTGSVTFNPENVITDPNPANTYGLKYFYEYYTTTGKLTRIEIEENGFAGSAEERKMAGVQWTFGNQGQSVFETIVRQSLKVSLLISSPSDYSEFLEADNRKFRVTYKRDGAVKFIGYVQTDFISAPEIAPPYLLELSVTDGLNSIDFERLALAQFAEKEKLSKFLIRSLNQSFQNKRKLVSSIRIFETNMTGGNDKDPLLEAEAVKLGFITEEDSEKVALTLKDSVERIARPFFARVFGWSDKWYIISLQEYDKAGIRLVQMDTNGAYESNSLLSNEQEITLLNNGFRSGRLAYTDFTVSINLSDLTVPDGNLIPNGDLETGAWEDVSFGFGDLLGYIPWLLVGWEYVNATPFDSIANVTSTTSRIERVVLPYQNTFARIWGTATSFADSNLSSIRTTPQVVAVEQDNILTFQLKFSVHRRLDSAPLVPIDHFIGFRLSVSDGVNTRWLATTDGVNFTWESTDTIVSFKVFNTGSFNNLRVSGLVLPISGQLTLQVFQLVNTGVQAQHLYALDIDDVALILAKNAELSFSKWLIKANTVTNHPNVLSEYETTLGDALSANNVNAMLVGSDVTAEWAREGVSETQSLLAIIAQGLANVKGKPNYSVTGDIHGVDITPLKAIEYDGGKWVLNYFTLDDFVDKYSVELISL